ncbi:MAG: T9SS type A sorting domain-containing protein [Fibrobacter sp.]|nr:T9SS type A sorting domain-containing protein [Fibrobacter sp.]
MKKNNKSQKSLRKVVLLLIVALIAITAVVAQTTAYTIYIIGDSTVCDYAESKYPWAGWGQVFSKFFKPGSVVVSNQAIGGRSTKSFYVEGRWKTNVYNVLKKGDFVFIQFGHNDRDYNKPERYADTTLYKDYLRKYVNESRSKQAIPVFVTPMNMNTWTNSTTLREVFTERSRGADYRGAMINVANELKVPLIDLEKKSAAYMKSVGQAYCTSYLFMGLQKGEYPNYPDGYSDGTHFQEMGAIINARMVAEGVKELASHADVGKLSAVLAPLYKLTVTPNKANTGLVTVSGDFPAGVTITVKVMPNSGQTFENWADKSGKSVSTKKLYTFTMPEAPVIMNAMFKGGSAVGVLNHGADTKIIGTAFSISMNPHRRIFTVSSGDPLRMVQLFDISGRCVFSQVCKNEYNMDIATEELGSGNYMVRVTTEKNCISKNLQIP